MITEVVDMLPTEAFYNDIVLYHDRVDKILKLIRDYFEKKKARCEKFFTAVEVIDGRVKKSTLKITQDEKESIEYWFRSDESEKSEINDSIYTLELSNRIFLCKIFRFNDRNSVLAGYTLNDSAMVRTFISKFSEQKIREKYEKILSIM